MGVGQTEQSTAIFPFLGNSEWLKSFGDAPAKLYATAAKDALSLTASLLQDQADYVKKLADCANPADAMKCQWEFTQKALSRSTEGASTFLNHLRTNGLSPGS